MLVALPRFQVAASRRSCLGHRPPAMLHILVGSSLSLRTRTDIWMNVWTRLEDRRKTLNEKKNDFKYSMTSRLRSRVDGYKNLDFEVMVVLGVHQCSCTCGQQSIPPDYIPNRFAICQTWMSITNWPSLLESSLNPTWAWSWSPMPTCSSMDGRSNDSFWRRLKSTNISSVLGGSNLKSDRNLKDNRDDNESEVTLVPQYVKFPTQTHSNVDVYGTPEHKIPKSNLKLFVELSLIYLSRSSRPKSSRPQGNYNRKESCHVLKIPNRRTMTDNQFIAADMCFGSCCRK